MTRRRERQSSPSGYGSGISRCTASSIRSTSSDFPGTYRYSPMTPMPRSLAMRRIETAGRPSSSATPIATSTIRSTDKPGLGPLLGAAAVPHSRSRVRWRSPLPEYCVVICVHPKTEYAVLSYKIQCTQFMDEGSRVPEVAIDADQLRKVYGGKKEGVAALDGFDLQVARGTVCGLLGPNGAGKTTAVRVLTTLARLEEGRASVAGHDVATAPDRVRERIGLVGQSSAVDEVLNARQNLIMFGRLFHLGASDAGRRADELLEQFDLTDTGDRSVKKFSGGM